jgi:hypothetical protein
MFDKASRAARLVDTVKARSKGAGWVFVSDVCLLTASASPAYFVMDFRFGAARDNLLWKPFCFALPAANHSRRDVARLISKFQLVEASVKPGVLGQMTHQTFRTGAGATASRPNASAVGAGAQWFDTTLNKPIWSDGTRWRDAVGNVV